METKVVKTRCKKTGNYYSLVVAKFGTTWKVVDFIPLSKEQGEIISSEVKQPEFVTNDNLLACKRCGNRKVGGCNCSKKIISCSSRMGYQFACIYCQDLEPIFTKASGAVGRAGDEIDLPQGIKVQITFSNVEWRKFDKIQIHPTKSNYASIEPKVHVITDEQKIEFHGYNVSEMNEGVYYTIDKDDDFEIVCDINTTTVQEHPEGFLYIEMGLITARINQNGGTFLLDGQTVARVGTKFNMALSLTNGGQYEIRIDGQVVGKVFKRNHQNVDITFGFWHQRHDCYSVTRAYITNIGMTQTRGGNQ